MENQQPGEFFQRIPDQSYDTTRPVPLDSSTDSVQVSVISVSQGSGMSGTSFSNNPTSTFNRIISGVSRMNFNQSMLEVHVKFSGSASNITSTAHNVCPPWNLLGSLINSIQLSFGSATTNVLNLTNYLPAFTSHHLRTYTLEQLSRMDSHLFTPIGSGSYVAQQDDAPCHGLFAQTTSVLGVMEGTPTVPDNGANRYVTLIGLEATSGIQAPGTVVYKSAVSKPCTPLTLGLTGRDEALNNDPQLPLLALTTELERNLYERFYRYIGRYGETTHQKTHVLRIGLSDLFCGMRIPSILRNLGQYNIIINWKVDTAGNLLEKFGSDSVGFVHVVGCQLIESQYVMSPEQRAITSKLKTDQIEDRFAFLYPEVSKLTYSGADVVISSVRDLSEVMIFQFLAGMVDESGFINYNSTGQLCLGPVIQTDSYVKNATSPVAISATDLQIQYDSIVYPEYPLRLVPQGGTRFDADALLYEHLKCSNNFADRTRGQGMLKWIMENELTFAHLRINAPTSGYKRHPANDLIIRLNCATKPLAANSDIYVVCWRLLGVTIMSDGTTLVSR